MGLVFWDVSSKHVNKKVVEEKGPLLTGKYELGND